MTRPRVLIFDFDGTIADTFKAGVEILNELAIEFGFRQLAHTEVEKARNMRTRELMRFLHIPTTKMSRIASKGSVLLRHRIESIQPLPGVPDMLSELRDAGFELGLLTSNTAENVGIFLRNHDLELLSFIRTSSKLMGKAREIRSVMKERGIAREEVLLIGDETRDIEAAKKTGLRIAAVTWGYNTEAALEKLQPEFVFATPKELVAFLKGL